MRNKPPMFLVNNGSHLLCISSTLISSYHGYHLRRHLYTTIFDLRFHLWLGFPCNHACIFLLEPFISTLLTISCCRQMTNPRLIWVVRLPSSCSSDIWQSLQQCLSYESGLFEYNFNSEKWAFNFIRSSLILQEPTHPGVCVPVLYSNISVVTCSSMSQHRSSSKSPTSFPLLSWGNLWKSICTSLHTVEC